jgi:hypothetical protein
MPPETKKKNVAIHDENGVITGYEAAALDDPRIEIPEMDLSPGRYRLDAEGGCYLPLAKPADGEGVAPAALTAIALGFKHLAENDVPIPLETLNWVAAHLASLDGAGDFDKESIA